MSEFLDHLSANDNDIYDLLISGKQRLTESVLREFARDRGIFCSPEENREDLADYLSVLPHGFHDVAAIVQKREPGHRREKTTFVRLNTTIPLEELKAVAAEYELAVRGQEKVVYRPAANNEFVMKVTYDEFNHSRTRLLQRERQEADIEFLVQDGQTVIRLPATDRAKKIVAALKENVERRRKTTIDEESIELTGLTTPEQRSKFFTRLISTLPGFRLRNVMSLKVSSKSSEDGEDDEALDLEEDDDDGGRCGDVCSRSAQHATERPEPRAISRIHGANCARLLHYRDFLALRVRRNPTRHYPVRCGFPGSQAGYWLQICNSGRVPCSQGISPQNHSSCR